MEAAVAQWQHLWFVRWTPRFDSCGDGRYFVRVKVSVTSLPPHFEHEIEDQPEGIDPNID